MKYLIEKFEIVDTRDRIWISISNQSPYFRKSLTVVYGILIETKGV